MTTPSYHASLEWKGTHGVLQAPDRPPLTVSARRAFGGDGDAWSPGELLVGAIASSLMSTFAALAEGSRIHLAGCSCSAVGTIGPTEAGWALTNVAVCFDVSVEREADRALVDQLMVEAREKSVVASSFRWDLTLESVITVAARAAGVGAR